MNPQPMYTQQELDAKLLAAANALRGPIDPADFKAYIFPLLFLKRISDTWHWERKQALEAFDGDEDLADLPENYRFVVPDGCRWEEVLALHENVGAGLQLVFDRLQEANPDTLAGVFGTAQWANKTVLPEERLTAVLDVFTGMQLDPESVSHDLLGAGYEFLLKNFADESGKKAGEFFTPRAVVRLMVRLLGPEENESVYDPTCGSGGMLVESVNQLRAHGRDARTLRLYGQEVSSTTAAIARMNLYLHEIETFSIKVGDTLWNPRLRNSDGSLQTFDAVIANPPFSIGKETPWGYERWAEDPWGRALHGVPPKGRADFAFVEHMLASLDARGGRLAVVMSHGVLFRAAEQHIRKSILGQRLLDAVIGLPPNVFYGTPLAACLLICRVRPKSEEPFVLFVDASSRFVKGKPKNFLSEADVDAVLRAYDSEAGTDGVPTRWVSVDEIRQNDWDLNISRYIEPPEDAAEDFLVALQRYRDAEDRVEDASSELRARLEALGPDA